MITPKYDLPTAIRIGAELRGQTRHGLLFYAGRSCVLGAAMEAENSDDPYKCNTRILWPELDMQINDGISLFQAVIALNDYARWTREEIADWLDMVLP